MDLNCKYNNVWCKMFIIDNTVKTTMQKETDELLYFVELHLAICTLETNSLLYLKYI